MQPTHTRVNQSEITPTVRKACPGDWTSNDGCCGICAVHRNDHESRKAGTYHIHLTDSPPLAGYGPIAAYCHVYRSGRLVTTVRARTPDAALTEARSNVRNARKAGGL